MSRWEMVRLGDIFKITSGGTPSKAITNYYEDGTIPWVKTGDLKGKYINIKNIERITDEGLANSSAKLFPCDTVLIAMYGATIGATSILNFEASTNQACAAFLPSKNMNSEFLYYFLYSQRANFAKLGVGGAQPNISATILKDVKIPLPPLDEQKRIAKILDLASEIVKSYKEQLAELDKLVQSVFYEMFGGVKNTVKLSHYIKSLNAGKSLAGTELCVNKVLKTGAVSYDYFDKNAVKYLPTEYEPDNANLVKKDDVIISRMNTIELVGATAYVWDIDANIYLPDRLWRAELYKTNANPIFVWQVLIQESTKWQIRKVASGTSGSMKNISKPNLLNICVIDVSLPLQTRFASIVTAIGAQKAQVQQALTEAENLFNSLMQEYFE